MASLVDTWDAARTNKGARGGDGGTVIAPTKGGGPHIRSVDIDG